MTHPSRSFIFLILTPLLLSCAQHTEAPANSSNSTSSAASVLIDEWQGQWNGPEGTFLHLAGGGGKYQITIQNLDGPRNFSGSTVGDQIHFQRDGVQEFIRATNGAATGMKWLSNKSTCLTIRSGEGYCRN